MSMGKEHKKGIQADNKVAVVINSGIVSIIPTAHSVIDGLVMNIVVAYAGKQGYIVSHAGVQGDMDDANECVLKNNSVTSRSCLDSVVAVGKCRLILAEQVSALGAKHKT